jgi:hypothetical protein
MTIGHRIPGFIGTNEADRRYLRTIKDVSKVLSVKGEKKTENLNNCLAVVECKDAAVPHAEPHTSLCINPCM